MEVCSPVSGETLAVLHPDAFVGREAKVVKKTLTARLGVSRFRLRLFVEDSSCEIDDGEVFTSTPANVQVVVLGFLPDDRTKDQRMMDAARNNELIELETLLKSPRNPNTKNDDGKIPVHDAANMGRIEAVQLLLEAGSEKDAQAAGYFAATPLHLAAYEGHLDVVRLLVEADAEKDLLAELGVTPAYLAALQGHLGVARYLVEAGADKDQASNDGATPLYIAAQHGHLDVVSLLVEAGADKDQVHNDGTTPLYIAAQQGCLDVVRFLLEASRR